MILSKWERNTGENIWTFLPEWFHVKLKRYLRERAEERWEQRQTAGDSTVRRNQAPSQAEDKRWERERNSRFQEDIIFFSWNLSLKEKAMSTLSASTMRFLRATAVSTSYWGPMRRERQQACDNGESTVLTCLGSLWAKALSGLPPAQGTVR